MKIFLAICSDRHIDVQVYPFTTRDAAISRAKKFVDEMAYSNSEITEEHIAGWEWYCRYGEDDSAYVVEADLPVTGAWLQEAQKEAPL